MKNVRGNESDVPNIAINVELKFLPAPGDPVIGDHGGC
jgi:hypothetical protein